MTVNLSADSFIKVSVHIISIALIVVGALQQSGVVSGKSGAVLASLGTALLIGERALTSLLTSQSHTTTTAATTSTGESVAPVTTSTTVVKSLN